MYLLILLMLSISPAKAEMTAFAAKCLNSSARKILLPEEITLLEAFLSKRNSPSSLEVILSEPLGVITFMEAINGEMGRPQSLRQTFLNSQYNTSENRAILANFRELQRILKESREPSSKDQASTDPTQEILKVSVTTKNEQEFFDAAKQILTSTHYDEFFEIYSEIKPVYMELVGNKFKRPMQQYIEKVKKEGMKWKMEEQVNCMAKFLRSDPEAAAKSPIGVYPSTRLGGVDGQSFVGVEIMGVHPRSQDIHGDISVVAHEKFHTLFHTQSDEKWEELHRWFGNDTDSQLALLNFEESVATIAGNVWAFEKATNQKASEPWYNDPSINEYAKAIVPLVKSHLDECKPMDNDFIEQVKVKYRELPESIREADRRRLEEEAR